MSAAPPADVLGYAELAAGAAQTASGGLVRAAYLHGSAVLGGWLPSSDVDLLLVAADGIGAAALAAVADSLVVTAAACPGRGLECSLVSATAAVAPGSPWPYLLHVATGPDEPGGSRVNRGADSPGDADLLMHYAVCRAAGYPVSGPPPRDLVGVVPRQTILAYLADELVWGLQHAAEDYAVLTACRAVSYLTDGAIVSKVAGGEIALSLARAPAGLVRRALAQHMGRAAKRPPAADAVSFVRAVAAALGNSARSG